MATTHEGTRILHCSCEHKDQDEMYGKGRRVFNLAGKEGNKWRCTVCKKEQS